MNKRPLQFLFSTTFTSSRVSIGWLQCGLGAGISGSSAPGVSGMPLVGILVITLHLNDNPAVVPVTRTDGNISPPVDSSITRGLDKRREPTQLVSLNYLRVRPC